MATVADVFQIAFWVVVGTIAVLTYRQARKTILQPLRTEVFKLQLEQMREVMSLFVGRDLDDDAHLKKLFDASAWLLIDSYAATFFPVTLDRDSRPYSGIRTYLMKPEDLALSEDHLEPDRSDIDKRRDSARLKKRENWPEGAIFGIPIPDETLQYQEKIRSVLQSPLIPTVYAKLLEDYLAAIDKNVSITGRVMEWAAPQLPDRYPTVEEVRIARVEWIHAHWLPKLESLDSHAERVTSFAREYFKADEFSPMSDN